MEYLKREDIKSFVTAGNVSEVYGLWLKHKKFHFRFFAYLCFSVLKS